MVFRANCKTTLQALLVVVVVVPVVVMQPAAGPFAIKVEHSVAKAMPFAMEVKSPIGAVVMEPDRSNP